MLLRVAGAILAVLALGGQLDGLAPHPLRAEARLAPALEVPEGLVAATPWPAGGAFHCEAACLMQVPEDVEGDLWVAWDGTRTAGFGAALDGEGGRPAFDAVRLGRVRGGEDVLVWRLGAGAADGRLEVVAPAEGLPSLAAIAPGHVGAPLPQGGSCLPEDNVASGQCLRFTTGVANVGDAPLALESGRSPGEMVQHLPGWDRAAGAAAYHASHGHFHYARFMAFDLHRVDPATGLRGEAVLSSSKTGFCMVDFGPVAEAEALPRKTYWRDGCESHRRTLEMGVNPGWYDIYRWFLPEQALDAAGLPDGTYELVATVDPDGTLLEADPWDNRASTLFTWSGGSATRLESRALYRL